MTITIFEKKDCEGKSQTISGSIADLRGMPADKPGSIRLTSDTESVLLFKNDDWHGGALYIRGPKTVSDLGSAKDGGRFGFGNSVRSVRVSAFTVNLNISVVTNGSDLPSVFPNSTWMDVAIRDAVTRANGFLISKRAMLNLEIARITYRDDPKHFNLSNVESWSYPSSWKEKGEVDVIFVNLFEKDGVGGRTKMPCFGKTVVVAFLGNVEDQPDVVFNTEDIANILVHEIGHYFGLGHGTADKDSDNIMFDTYVPGSLLSSRELDVDQVREMQDRLANNISRRGDRD
jgi:hypothetical protein